MFVFRSLLILFVLQYTKCERRIINGERIDKPYVVYLVWDLSNETLNEQYDTRTICGGVLILPNAVLSSAACLKMFEIQYAIAGYNRYVPGGEGRNKYETECLELAKKPIIEKCIPSQFDLYRPWIHFDIAVARLETSYDLNDQSFATKCSYQPKTAALKFEMLENIVNRDVLVFGWGSDHYHPPTDYTNDLSQDFLRATSTKIIDISQCAFAYGNLKLFRYCTEGQGFVDIHGKPKVFRRDRTNNASNVKPLYIFDIANVKDNKTFELLMKLGSAFRRNGPCHNDHGGPLTTWEKGQEIVIGVINGYLVNNKMECVGPFMYRSLAGEIDLIKCSLKKWSGKQ